MTDLNTWGFSDRISSEASAYNELSPARIIEQQRNRYMIVCEARRMPASVSGKFIH